MKLNKRINCLVSLLILSICLLNTCKESTKPSDNIKLELMHGYYQVINGTSDEVKYFVEFKYFVKGTSCNIGGYGIDFDESTSSVVDWYSMQTITPNQTYSIADTFRVSKIFHTDPKAIMQGYFENSSESDPRLRGQCTLRKK